MYSVFASVVITAIAQQPEPTIAKDSLSVHRVERGVMPLREMAEGSISSIAPPRATVIVSAQQQARLRIGQTSSIQIAPPAVLAGKVRRINQSASNGTITAELELVDALPEGTSIGAKIGALIEVGVATDVLFFGRPADTRPHSTSSVFVLEPDGEHARRVVVEYGRPSGSLIEILKGLSEGDRVIVTDMSRWAGHDRVRLK
jgi:multidrug efflux pump subunit AcrA (membrane-fusion protein)